jgi:NADH-quinone oxidoreductase subunit L
MFFLDHAWLVPLIPALSFVVILLFGKRFPRDGAEVGILAVGASFVLSCGAALQWINRVQKADNSHGVASAIGALGRGIGRLGPAGGEARVLPVIHQFTWFENAGTKLTVGTQIDGLAVMMMFVVTLISLLVHVYSLEYMRGDRRFTHFYAALSLFTASMLLLVVASNTLQMLVGWELVGLCSFMLIGHWWEEKPNSDAALKAFLTTRTGDIGLLTGVIMTYYVAQSATGHGTFNILVVNASAASSKVSHTLVLWCALALLLAIIGKSGQFPLHTWLPDAMAGPTPVSALIHAATMVVAGVYLGARLYPIFWYGLSIGTPGHGGLNAMAVIGGITVLIGAALAFVQDDIKKVLAYSTISQLGFMVMALGVGAWTAAVFHLFTHAFFKADLFLGAGSVSHSGSHHSFDMKKDMGGLRKYMPQTFWTFIIGSLALAGIFPLAGFWSKDEILVNAGHNGYQIFIVVGAIGAFMTAAYMTRCVYLTFFGEYRGSVEHELAEVHEAEVLAEGDELIEHHLAEEQDDYIPGFGAHAADDHGEAHGPHESNGLITVPLWILSFFAVFAGFLNIPHFQKFETWFQPRAAFVEVTPAKFNVIVAIVSLAIAALGIVVSYLYYWKKMGPQGLSERNPLARAGKHFLVMKYYLDVLYTDIIVASIKGPIATGVYWFNQHVIDNVLNYAGRGAVALGKVTYEYVDQRGVDGAVNGIATLTGESGGAIRRIQTGRLQFYALILVVAVGLFALSLWIFT